MTVTDLRPYGPVLSITLLLIALQGVGPDLLRYDPRAIAAGEPWRLISGHLVHANGRHLLLNLTGLWLCQALTGVRWSLWQWLWRTVFLVLAISLAFWFWQPEIQGYVGFSGVLFGLYLLAAAESWSRQLLVSSLLVGLLVVKILLEQFSSVKIDSGGWIGVPVLVDAHLYGFLAALLLLLLRQGGRLLGTLNAHE